MKEIIFISVRTFLERVHACLNSIFLGGIDKLYADLVGSDLGSR
jgi:hypothetical protein